ncbi:hypothetical protein [Sphingomonas sp. ID0503]|uniref:hypothetical protein n=1 Tax=Sphingomonas sp. ID0503 TaxID=3399691 RepID=UPI003AFB5B18
MTTLLRRYGFVLVVLFWAAMVFACVMATIPSEPQMLSEVRDKYQHIAAFTVLALTAAIAYPRTPLLRIAERLSFLGAMIELVQSIPSLYRDCDIWDWVADTGAILVTLAIVQAVRSVRAR